MEKDFIDGAIAYGPQNLSVILYEHNIMSSSNIKLIDLLSEYVHPTNISVMLVEILANNVKDKTVFKDFNLFFERRTITTLSI